MPTPTIVTCAVTGNITSRSQHAALPVTPTEIAEASVKAARAGAAIAHIHVRDPVTGAPSMEFKYYKEVVDRIRDSNTDLIVNLTTGAGGRFVPGSPDPRVAGPGSTLLPPDERVSHVLALEHDVLGRFGCHQHAIERRAHGRADPWRGCRSGVGGL
jgi:uncharacterized protein (DUF849 family)